MLDLPCFLLEGNKESLAGLCTPSKKSQPLLPWDPAREDWSSTGHAVPVLLLPALVWSTHKNSAEASSSWGKHRKALQVLIKSASKESLSLFDWTTWAKMVLFSGTNLGTFV